MSSSDTSKAPVSLPPEGLMINGKGTGENCSEVASLDQIDGFTSWNGHRSDGGDDDSPVISQYSSCGESDFEKYCSAPSMMGTPSMCSSIGAFQDCGDSEFGSVKSFRHGDDASGSENFSLGGKFDRSSEEKKLSSLQEQDCFARSPSLDGNSDTEGNNYKVLGQTLVGMKNGLTFHDVTDFNAALDEELFGGNDDGCVVSGGGLSQVGAMQSSFEDQSSQKKTNVEFEEPRLEEPGANIYLLIEAEDSTVVEQVDSCLERMNPEPGLGITDRTGAERYSDEDEAPSRYEHSEGEDSVFGCATDDEQKSEFYHNRSTQNPHGSIVKYQNSLHMTPSVAFGSDDWDDFILNAGENTLDLMVPFEHQGREQQCKENERHTLNSASATNIGGSIVELPNQQEYARCIPGHSNEFYSVDKLVHHGTGVPEQQEKVRHAQLPTNQLQGTKEVVELRERVRDWHVRSNAVIGPDDSARCPQSFSPGNRSITDLDSRTEEVSLKGRLHISHGECNTEHGNANSEVSGIEEIHLLENSELDKINLEVDPLSDIRVNQYHSTPVEANENRAVEYLKGSKSEALRSLAEIKTQNIEVNELYDEVVHDMEEILLDSDKSPGGRFAQGNRLYQSRVPLPARDGGFTASTSGTDDPYPLTQHPLRIDGIEVVGARQKKGDVSLGERLVGVKEYTVYKIRVWSGDFHWEVEHRYRDFYTLYRRLKSFFADQGWTLPTPWSFVEKESRKLFGSASPAVVSERSVLIQECLQSILHLRFTSSLPNALIWFLSPASAVSRNPASDTPMLQSLSPKKGTDTENISLLGKTISLVVQIHPHKSMRQMLELQYYACAGCHKHFDDGKTLMQEFAQTLGWGKPRLCEYSNQLFCSSCHLNETAVLPARVLHLWDFTEYPVSQLAKSYLDSIHDQPMLCVSAVNPFLFSKVPALQNVTNMRRKIGVMLPYVRCPFQRSICRVLGSRRYLLESNDFFALRDLIDLSKGVFAVLPVMVETISKKILEHITEQCLVCCDVGVPCNARQACDNPTSLIFPFQEGEIERCTSCKSVFHNHCFKKVINCPCGMRLKPDDVNRVGTIKGGLGTKLAGTLDLLGSKSSLGSPVEFLSGLFSKARPGVPADNDTVISMGSLPSTFT